jgi:LysM repeat protein
MDETTQHSPPPDEFLTRRSARPDLTPPAPRPRTGLRALLIGLISGVAVFVLVSAMTAAGAYVYYQTFHLILPGVSVGNVDLGGMTPEEAAFTLETTWQSQDAITYQAEDRRWTVSPAELGLTLDTQASARAAADYGHGKSLPAEIADFMDSALTGYPIEPQVSFDAAAARRMLTARAAEINQPPQDASIKIEAGSLIAVPGQDGYSLDVEATVAGIEADPVGVVMQGYLPLTLVPIAPLVSDVSGSLAQAQSLLDTPLAITVYDPITDERFEHTAAPEQIAGWLAVQPEGGIPSVGVDEGRLAEYLKQIGDDLGEGRFLDPARNTGTLNEALAAHTPAVLMVSHRPTTYTVQAGDSLTAIAWQTGIPYWRILNANPALTPDALKVGQEISIPSTDDLLPLPVILNKRLRLSLSEQRLWAYEDGEQIAEYMISTGIDRSPTQPGVFQVQTHEINAYASVWDLTMPHFLGIYESWPGFMNGFHGLPLLSSGVRLWADVLGKPASFGCIILSLEDAETLYNWAENGVVVEIRE